MRSMKLAVEIAFMLISLWSAHLSGVHLALAREDPRHKRAALVRACFAIASAGVALLIVR